MDARGLILLEEMVLVCWSLSFIDEDNASSDTIEHIAARAAAAFFFFSAPSVGVAVFGFEAEFRRRAKQMHHPRDCVWSDGTHFASAGH